MERNVTYITQKTQQVGKFKPFVWFLDCMFVWEDVFFGFFHVSRRNDNLRPSHRCGNIMITCLFLKKNQLHVFGDARGVAPIYQPKPHMTSSYIKRLLSFSIVKQLQRQP